MAQAVHMRSYVHVIWIIIVTISRLVNRPRSATIKYTHFSHRQSFMQIDLLLAVLGRATGPRPTNTHY